MSHHHFLSLDNKMYPDLEKLKYDKTELQDN
jgi:hypothetical protein